MASASETKTRYMLDTNCFNRIVERNLSLHARGDAAVVCTGVQRDELCACKDHDKRQALLKAFEGLNPEIEIASSFCFDIEGAGWGQAHWNDATGRFDAMLVRLKELDEKSKKRPKDPRNQIRDIVNAETALKRNLIFVTTDEDLENLLKEFGGRSIRFDDFVAHWTSQ